MRPSRSNQLLVAVDHPVAALDPRLTWVAVTAFAHGAKSSSCRPAGICPSEDLLVRLRRIQRLSRVSRVGTKVDARQIWRLPGFLCLKQRYEAHVVLGTNDVLPPQRGHLATQTLEVHSDLRRR